jgi:hypothetical protein
MRSYQSLVASLCPRFPHLSHLSNFLENSSPYPLGRIACLEFFGSNGAGPTTARRLTLAELTSLIKPRQGSPTCNRVLIIEDLTKEVIEVLGSGLSIDPTFFAHHLHSSRIEDSTAYTCPIRVLPSVRNQENFIIVSYVATVIFDRADPPPDRLRCSSNVRRKLTVLGLGLSCGFSAALISRKFSVLRVPQGCGWLGKAEVLVSTFSSNLRLSTYDRHHSCGPTNWEHIHQ